MARLCGLYLEEAPINKQEKTKQADKIAPKHTERRPEYSAF